VRHSAGRLLIRSILDIRLSRLSMLALGAVSVAATVFILAGGSGRSTAQLAALAALRQRPVTVTQTTPAPPVTTAATPRTPTIPRTGTIHPPAAPASTAAPRGSPDPGSGTGASTASTSTTGTTTTSSSTAAARSTLPKVGHVFEIALSTTGYDAAFGHGSAAPYLRSLEAKGTLLSGYRSLGEGELADELAMVSGQAPNRDTEAGCTTYSEFPTGVAAHANGTVPGTGCVYPETALTIGDQVSASGHTWRAYIAGMGTAACAHPNSGATDDLALSGTETGYDTRHNPFIYFHSLLDLGDCQTSDIDLGHLDTALERSSRTATYSFIAPDTCSDAAAVVAPSPAGETSTTTTTTTTSTSSTPAPGPSATAARCPSGQAAGIAAEDAFLKQWVPRILRSAAYRADGVLIVAFAGDATSNPGHATRTGALVLSRYARRHHTLTTAYGPYSLLRSVEDMLGYSPLAHAKSAPSFATAALADGN
jgi:hypothetical protein